MSSARAVTEGSVPSERGETCRSQGSAPLVPWGQTAGTRWEGGDLRLPVQRASRAAEQRWRQNDVISRPQSVWLHLVSQGLCPSSQTGHGLVRAARAIHMEQGRRGTGQAASGPLGAQPTVAHCFTRLAAWRRSSAAGKALRSGADAAFRCRRGVPVRASGSVKPPARILLLT